MKLRIKLLLIIIFVFLTLFTSTEYIRYRSIKSEVVNNLLREAKNIRSVLMATRRVYHHQFLESGIPLTDKTIGFLPAHSLSRISEDFKNWTESGLYFNNVSDRPRNPRNRADPLEMKAINYFRENSTEKERFVSFKSEEDELFYHYSTPIWIEKYCLKCHGKREDADIAIRTRYATAFNYKVGELRGVMSIKLPATQLKALVWANFQRDLWVHLACFAGMFFLVSWLLRRYVTNPVSKLTLGLEEVAGGNFEYPIEELSGEMSIVGKAFNRMSGQLGQRESELRESEERYRDLFENANDLIQSITPDGHFVYVNRSWRETLGYTKEEVLKLTLFDIIHPDSHSHYMETFVNVISGEKVVRVETVFVSKSGKNIIVEGSINCCFKEGEPVSTRGIYRDITERKHTEERNLKRARIAALGADIGVALTKTNTLRVILEGCVEAFVKHLDVAFARIWTLNQEKDMLELQASAGMYTHIDGSHSRVPVGSLKIGMIARKHKAHLTNDVINDPKISDKDWARREGMVAFAGYPLIVEDQLVGVMALFARQPLTKEIFDALGSVADTIALGIERKRVEVQIRKLSRVVEQSPNIVVITDTKGSIEYVNPKFIQLTGYSLEEAIGETPRVLKSGRTPPEVYKELWKTITSGNEWRGEFCNKKKNGELYWESACILPIKNEEGGIIHFVAIKEDITVQRQASQELKRVNEQLQISIDQMPVGYILFDKEFRVLEWNQAAERIFGYSKSEVLGKYVANLIVPEEVGQQVEEVIKTLQKGEVSSYSEENNNISKDGKLISCQWYNTPLKDRSGNTFSILSMVEDVTESKQAENLLRKSEEKYRRLIENLQDNYFFYVHNSEGVFTYISPSLTNILGYSAEEFLTHYSEYLTDNPINKDVMEHTELSLKGIKQPLYEAEIYHKDGTIRSLQVQETPIFNDDRMVIAVEGIAQDITERRKMEKELIKVQKLESVGVLAGGIAHDFNNSLQAILGYITMAEIRTNPDDEIKEYLNEAIKAIFHSKGLTQQLLTFSRGGEPVKSILFISKLIRNSARLALSGSNIRCDLSIPDDLWPVKADKGQLNQVISNLVINANQAMPKGGIIRIKAENINVNKRVSSLPLKEKRYVMITIKDHGTGISQEYLQKIFDPYFTTKQKGSGLGLATTYSIIKKHDGYITVESEIGVGTTFHIYLPASQKRIQKKSVLSKAEEACPEPVNGKEVSSAFKGKVLLMDDEHVIRTVLSSHLRHLKYEVEAVDEGTEAIRSYKSASRTGKPFDAVLIDLTISGGMGGKETIERLLEIDPEVRAIVVSGYANDPIMANYKKYGFRGVLAKPHEIHELDDALQKVMKSM